MANRGSLVAALEIEGHAGLLWSIDRTLTCVGSVLFGSLDNVYGSCVFFELGGCSWRLEAQGHTGSLCGPLDWR